MHPAHKRFMGWDETTLDAFDFEKNFLHPNELNIQQFLGHFSNNEYIIRNYFWRDINEQVSGPYETYFRIKKERGKIHSMMAFVKLTQNNNKVELPPHQKFNYFLAKPLPGFIHNINGPLGTLTGRIELLNYKYQNIKELNELLKLGFKIQGMLETVSFKLVNERFFQPVPINLNRLLREEIKFLNSDLFLKHQVEVQEKYSGNIPQFRMYYLAISGVFSECYYFIRNFVYEDQEYVMSIGSFCEERNTGFFVNLMGDFHIPDNLSLRFPISLSGDAVSISQQTMEGIDTAFLVYCLKHNKGKLQVSGRKELMSIRLEFPLPDKLTG